MACVTPFVGIIWRGSERPLCVSKALAWGGIRASLGNGALPLEMEVPQSGFLLRSCQALAAHSELVKTVLVSM